MHTLGIGRTLLQKRREKGITQEELAEYIGVSKASVSKWETGQSYPDITFLPRLAAYFAISIDALMDYRPQMDGDEIRSLIGRLKSDFATRAVDEVLEECRLILQTYHACPPLLLQMGTLLLNHTFLLPDAEAQQHQTRQCRDLFSAVRNTSTAPAHVVQATVLEALCHITLNEPQPALTLMAPHAMPYMPVELLQAAAYVQLNQTDRAIELIQGGAYQSVIVLCNMLCQLLTYGDGQPHKVGAIAQRMLAVTDAFDLDHLHPGFMLGPYLVIATAYAQAARPKEALCALQKCWALASGPADFDMHGDGFFDRIEPWLNALDTGTALPRSKETVQKSLCEAILQSPAFEVLQAEPPFIRLRAEALALKEQLS